MEKSGKLGESDGRTENKGGNKRNEGQRKGYYALEEVTRERRERNMFNHLGNPPEREERGYI